MKGTLEFKRIKQSNTKVVINWPMIKICVMTRIMEMEMKKRQAGTKYRFYIKWKDLYIYSFSSMLIESGISKRLNPIG